MEMGPGFPDQFISILRMHNAALPRQEVSLVMASSRERLKFEEVAANMRRLFGSRSRIGRQYALITEEAVGPLESGGDLDALSAYNKAKRQGVGKKKKNGGPERGGDKVRGGRQT